MAAKSAYSSEPLRDCVSHMEVIDKNKTRIRRYLEKDIDMLVNKLCEEVPKLPHYKGIAVDADRIRFFLQNSTTDESAFMAHMLVNEDDVPIGGVAGYCVTSLLSWDKFTGDIFLYVLPEWRSLFNVIKLINTYKEWGKRRGAKIIQATHTGGYRSDAMDTLLQKQGFERVGILYHLREE